MTDFGDRSRRPEPKSTVVWLAGAMCVVALWALSSLGGNAGRYGQMASDGADGIGMLVGSIIGASLGIALLTWLVLYFAVVRREGAGRGGPHFVILMGTALLIQGGGVALLAGTSSVDRAQDAVAMRSVADAMEALTASGGMGPIDTTVHATGEAAVTERVVKTLLAELASNNRALDDELKAIGFADLMAPRHLAADPGMRKTRAALARAMVAVETQHSRQTDAIRNFHKAVQSSTLSDRDKADLIRGFEEGRATSTADVERIWAINRDSVAEMDAAAAVLQASPHSWVLQGDALAFSDSRAMNSYNQHILKLEALQAELQRLTQQGEEDARAAIADARRP